MPVNTGTNINNNAIISPKYSLVIASNAKQRDLGFYFFIKNWYNNKSSIDNTISNT